jgi:membrane protein insertase Oxa1/YidC/SpoIIIJ
VQFVIPSADASNGLVDMVGNTASGSISTAGEVMNSPMGYIIYFIIWLALVGLAVGTVLYWSNKW